MCELSYNELRKGNLLCFPFISGNVEVIGINAIYGVKEPYFNKLSVIEGINMYYEPIEVFKAIQLTEEWLVNFGFENREFSFDKGSFYLIKRTGGTEFLYQSHTHRFEVKYVHQLQNLYFSNRQAELTQHKN